MSATQTQTNDHTIAAEPSKPSIIAVGDSAAPGRVIPPFKYADLLDHGPYGDFRDALVEDGFVVVKNVMSQERAAEIRSKAFDWLESFGRGFDRTKPETFGQQFLPKYGRGGMYQAYGVHHEQWVWDCRLEPGVKATFAKLWGTDKLVSSFDGGAVMMPFQPPMSVGDSSWHHIDLNPSRVGFHCAQGIVNLNENGPDDGGLVVMKGSSKLMKEFFDVHGRPPVPAGKIDTYGFKVEDKQWFFDRGCEWLKGKPRLLIHHQPVAVLTPRMLSSHSLRRPWRPHPVALGHYAPRQGGFFVL